MKKLPIPTKLFAEVHPIKNGAVHLEELSAGSGKKLWWRCLTNTRHPDWQTSVWKRARLKRDVLTALGKRFFLKIRL
jgi:hypothetical protein